MSINKDLSKSIDVNELLMIDDDSIDNDLIDDDLIDDDLINEICNLSLIQDNDSDYFKLNITEFFTNKIPFTSIPDKLVVLLTIILNDCQQFVKEIGIDFKNQAFTTIKERIKNKMTQLKPLIEPLIYLIYNKDYSRSTKILSEIKWLIYDCLLNDIKELTNNQHYIDRIDLIGQIIFKYFCRQFNIKQN